MCQKIMGSEGAKKRIQMIDYKWFRILQAALISFAFTVKLQGPLRLQNFEEKIDYLIAEVNNLLGEYRMEAVFLFLLAFLFLQYAEKRLSDVGRKGYVLSFFFSFCYYMGTSYDTEGSWSCCFGSITNFIKFAIALVGMTIFLRYALYLLVEWYEKLSSSEWQCRLSNWLFGRQCFLKIFGLLLVVWAPAILISYPGNLCYDSIGQIEQAVGNAAYSAHHPLLSTLLMGGCVNLGGKLFGSYEVGLFLYILVQALMLSSALAGTLWWLTKQTFTKGKVSHVLLCIILGIYICSPMYSNMVTTVIKDIPFVAVFVWYMILLAELCLHGEKRKQAGFWVAFVGVQVLVSVLRNNGFYVVVLSGVMLCLIWWKQSDKKARLQNICYMLVVPVVLSKLLGFLLLVGLSAQEGKAAEIFSLPFQQTARYLQLYRQEVTPQEAQAIEQVLGDINEVAAKYDPDLADPVKSMFYDHEEVTTAELIDYFVVWVKGFFKHPGVYFEGFFHHVYGWFSPQVSNAVRYEAEYELIPRQGLFTDANKVMIFIYRFADRITPLGILQNVGAYTWAMFVLLAYAYRKNRRVSVLLIPLLLSLLICMAAPGFFLHPRYAYPYMFTIPFLYGLAERSRE